MVAFDSLEDIFQSWRNFSEYSKALVTLATAIGTVVVLIYFIRLVWSSIEGLRLYVFSQCCCRTDYRKKYGEWAVISGSTDGIGLAMAKELANRGHSIIVVGRNEERLANTKNMLEAIETAGEIITVKIDLSDSSPENYERIRRQIDPDNRDIGILINNAGTFPGKFTRFCEGDSSYLRDIMNVNMLAVVFLTQMILPGMLKREKGLVANVSSMLGSIPAPYMSVYGPTKAFVNEFSRTLQIEYSSHPVDIINLTPGAVTTKLFEATASLEKPTPFNPTPEDYARTSINALATGISSYCGTIAHGLSYEAIKLFDSLGLIPILFKINLRFNAKNVHISPVGNRKQPQTGVEEETALSDENNPQPTGTTTKT